MQMQGSGEQLTLLAEISAEFSHSLDINQTLANGIDRIMTLMQAEAASIFLFGPGNERLTCLASACAWAGHSDACSRVLGLELEAGEGIVGRVASSGLPEMIRDVRNDPNFAAFVDEATGFASRSIIAVPLLVNAGSLGAIELVNKQGERLFDAADQAALSMLATVAALAINNARMTVALVEQERMRRELELARGIQASLMPSPRAQYPVTGLNIPAKEVSGDFFDYFDLADGQIGFSLADVSGKGINAALLGVKAATLLRSLGRESLDPGEMLARVNDELSAYSMGGMFITAITGLFNPETGVIRYANAGHPPPLLITAGAGVRLPEAKQPPLGIQAGFTYPTEQVALGGGGFYLYTDGVSESMDEQGRELGVDGVLALLVSLSPMCVSDRLEQLVAQLAGNNEVQRDDITVMILEGRAEADELTEIAHIRVAARPESLRLIRKAVWDALDGLVSDQELAERLVLAVSEASMNVIQHAFGAKVGPQAKLKLVIGTCAGYIKFDLTDNAPPGEVASFQGRALDELKPGGLGLHFIHEIMDKVEYSHRLDETGNRLVMGKRMP